ncbi:MAG: alpha/beta fold hydrolase [Saprospiraceae bacterium]|nr:alpha/beta fold hydrolase [Saprospiraceae bacterium]
METPLILLHGAIGSAAQFDALRPHLGSERPVFALSFPGHGGSSADEPFSMSRFSDFVLRFLEKEKVVRADFFGYSMGGYVALYLAWQHPERVRRVFTLGTKFDWTPETAARESAMLNAEKIAEKVPAFAQMLAARHAPADWKEVLRRTADMLRDLGAGQGLPAEAFARIGCPVTIGLGELDNMVTLEESRAVASALPRGSLEILTACKHPMEQVDVVLLAERLCKYFELNVKT